MASIFEQLNPLKNTDQKPETTEVSWRVKARLQRVGQAMVAKRASLSAVSLLILLAWLWLSYEATPETTPIIQHTLALPSASVSATSAAANPQQIASISSAPATDLTTNKPAQPAKPTTPSVKPDTHSLSLANQKAIELALAGQASQATVTLEQALLNDPQAGMVFDNLRRLYAGFASQSYQLAIEPNSAKPVMVELASSDKPINIQLDPPSASSNKLVSKPVPALASANSSSSAEVSPNSDISPTTTETRVPVKEVHKATTDQPQASITTLAPPREPTPAQKEAAQRKANLQAVQQALKNWSDAWSKQDVKGYFASYAPNYSPKNSTRKAWMDYRQERILAPKRIKVELSDVKVVFAQPTQAKVSFTQSYTSDTLSARDQKTLTLELINNAWLITSESGR